MWWKEHFPVLVLKPNCSWPWINHRVSLGLIFLLCKINCLNWLSLRQFSQSFTCLPLLLRGEKWRLCGVSVPLVKDRLTPVLPPLPAGHSTHSGVPAIWLASTCTQGAREDPYQLQRISSEGGWETGPAPRTPLVGSSLNTDVFQTSVTFLKIRSPVPSVYFWSPQIFFLNEGQTYPSRWTPGRGPTMENMDPVTPAAPWPSGSGLFVLCTHYHSSQHQRLHSGPNLTRLRHVWLLPPLDHLHQLASVSFSGCLKWPQMFLLKPTRIYSLTDLKGSRIKMSPGSCSVWRLEGRSCSMLSS